MSADAGEDMRVLGWRVDALTVAYRVKLDPAFVEALRARAEVAKKHGRAAIEWLVRVPDDDGDGTTTTNGRHKVGPLPLRWADEVSRARLESKVWGELRYSRVDKCWRITNEPYFRLQVTTNAPGGGALRDCASCAGLGMVARPVVTSTVVAADGKEACPACQGSGSEEEPGWTLEVIWYAQTLADWGLERTLRESAALASNCGEVLETRLRRLDLCADVAGWELDQDDLLDRLVKRPHAEWREWNQTDDEEKNEAWDARAVVPKASPEERKPRRRKADGDDEDRVAIYGKGAMQARRVTGLVVGRGPFMCRVYDKRAELSRSAERRELEEDRWRERGWDGIEPVTRVEFQLRGVALTEFGLRDPDAVLVPVTRTEEYLDARGRMRTRVVVTGHELMTVRDDAGREVQATVVHRLDDLWRACLAWVRLVEPEESRNGRPKPACRLDDDPRWSLLKAIRFTDAAPRPIRRHRPRAAASSAQALGVALSQAARDGRLREPLPEDRAAYREDERTESLLRARTLMLFVDAAARVVADLKEKYGGIVGASEHLAVRWNASRARFARGVEDEEDFAPLDPCPAPMVAAG